MQETSQNVDETQAVNDNIAVSVNGNSDLDAHFESEIEAAEAVQEEIVKNRSIIERIFPTWFMSPGEVINFLESVRDDVVSDLDQAA